MKRLKIEIHADDDQKLSEINTRLIQLGQEHDLRVTVNGNAGELGNCGIFTDLNTGVTTIFLEWIELKDIAG
jgi:hypothetical protein